MATSPEAGPGTAPRTRGKPGPGPSRPAPLPPRPRGESHTDFERGFIRAEVTAYEDFVVLGGEYAAKEAGKLRLEGRNYIVREGDIMHFRFNV